MNSVGQKVNFVCKAFFVLMTVGFVRTSWAQSKTTCAAPVKAVNTSSPRTVVGNGTAASCTQTALATALSRGGIIRFNCGNQATILLNKQLNLPIHINTVIDGQGKITLDGQGRTRILSFNSPNFRTTRTVVTIQNMKFQNGFAAGTALPSAPAPCSRGTDVDGGGGAIYVRDGILRVINSQFTSNKGAALGPDVAGGAIYTIGSLETTIVASTFTGNSASNGGAVGALFGNPSIYNSLFDNNSALGNGANNYSETCPSRSTGNGGNAGAFYIDGSESTHIRICGTRFRNNKAGARAFGGAIFRAINSNSEGVNIDRSLFAGNRAPSGGAIYANNLTLLINASTLRGNVATAGHGGGVFLTNGALTFINSTFYNNQSTGGLGGGVAAINTVGSFLNLTFAQNKANSGPGYFGAALHADRPLEIRNTLYVQNISSDCYNPMSCSWGHNTGQANMQWPRQRNACAEQDNLCGSGTSFRNPLISSALAQNGGPTPTLLPSVSSPARQKGIQCPPTDQRGIARSRASCTLGAVE